MKFQNLILILISLEINVFYSKVDHWLFGLSVWPEIRIVPFLCIRKTPTKFNMIRNYQGKDKAVNNLRRVQTKKKQPILWSYRDISNNGNISNDGWTISHQRHSVYIGNLNESLRMNGNILLLKLLGKSQTINSDTTQSTI